MGWPFAAAEFSGGIVMVVLIALIFRVTLTPRLVEMAHRQAEKRLVGRMEGHAHMDMSVEGGSLLSRLLSGRGFTAISHYFVMDWASVWMDVVGGFLIAGALAAWVPESFWRASSWSTIQRWHRSKVHWWVRWWRCSASSAR